jgi:hypothetical protein
MPFQPGQTAIPSDAFRQTRMLVAEYRQKWLFAVELFTTD